MNLYFKENSDKTLKFLYQQANKATVKNAVVIAFVLLYNSCSNSRVMNQMLEVTKEQARKNEIANNSVIGLTEDGYMLNIEKMMISAHGREKEASKPLIDYLMVSGYEITDNLRRTEFKNKEAVLRGSEKLQTFKEEFIVLQMPSYFIDKHGVTHFRHKKEGTQIKHIDGETYTLQKNMFKSKKHEENEEKGLQSFNAYLTYLRTAIIKGTLPHKITVKGTKVLEYTSTDSSFNITVQVDTVLSRIIGLDGDRNPVYEEGDGKQIIKAEGYFDIKTKTTKNVKEKQYGINNLGLHYTKLEFELEDFTDSRERR